MRVFFEPKIPLHDPELYAFGRIDRGVAATAAGSEAALERYRTDGFLMARGLVSVDAVRAARAELEAMALAERPGCKRRDWQICDTDVETAGRVAVPMQAGDVLFFDGKLPHSTAINRTEQFRWAVQYHYRPAGAREIDDRARLDAFGNEGREVTC